MMRSSAHGARLGLLAILALQGACAPGVRSSGGGGVAPGTVGLASWYGERFQGRPTASGEPFDMRALTAAHRTLPFGTRVRVTHLENGRSVVVRVNDRGPFVEGRIIDLSRAAAEEIDMVEEGTARVRVEVLSTPSGEHGQ